MLLCYGCLRKGTDKKNKKIYVGKWWYSDRKVWVFIYPFFFNNTSWLIFIIIKSIVCYSKPFPILFKCIIFHNYGLFGKNH